MSNEKLHIVNKQLFELECTTESYAFEMRHKINYDVQYRMAKIMEQACDDINEDIRIAVLEIDLGTISFDRLETELLAAFEKKFAEQLTQYKPVHVEKRYTRILSSLEILQHFLKMGELPWYAGKQDEHYLSTLFEEILLSGGEQLRNFILLNLHDDRFITRLVEQANESHLRIILKLLAIDETVISEMEFIINRILAEITAASFAGKQGMRPGDLILQTNESNTSYYITGEKLLQYIQQSPLTLARYLRKMTAGVLLKTLAKQTKLSLLEQIVTNLKSIIAEQFDITTTYSPLQDILTGKSVTDLVEKISVAKAAIDESMLSLEQHEKETEAGTTPKFYVANAGLILLANYLPAFFNELQLLEHGNFKNRSAQVKAVFLLYYLCSGSEEAPEYILPLNKLLCGLPLDIPLPSFVPLSNTEKEECTELLQEIINNWQRLGNSTIDGLREAFLNRDGILQFENNGWKLIIDRMGHDVLLESLPWSFAHTKLSWMQHLITTEW